MMNLKRSDCNILQSLLFRVPLSLSHRKRASEDALDILFAQRLRIQAGMSMMSVPPAFVFGSTTFMRP